MGPGQWFAQTERRLALHLLHLEHYLAGHGHYDLQLRGLPGKVEQDAAHYRDRSDAHRGVPRRLDYVHLLGLAHSPDGHQGQTGGPAIPQPNKCQKRWSGKPKAIVVKEINCNLTDVFLWR